MQNYKLILENNKLNLPWNDEKWLISQIILELSLPTYEHYIFNRELLEKNLIKICLNDIIPFYSDKSILKQDEKEKEYIKYYYKNILGFGDFVENLDKKLTEEISLKVSENIINLAKQKKIIKQI